jgi:hypothetical protein
MQTVTLHSGDLRIEYRPTQNDGTLGPPVVTQVPEFATPAPVPQPASAPAVGLLLDFGDGSTQGEISVSSFHMGEALPLGSFGSASTPQTFTLTLPAGADLPALFHALHADLPNGRAAFVPLRAVLSVRNAAGQAYLTYTLGSNFFGLVVVQSLEFGSDGSATLTLQSTHTKIEYRPTLPDGTLGTAVTAEWIPPRRGTNPPPATLTLPASTVTPPTIGLHVVDASGNVSGEVAVSSFQMLEPEATLVTQLTRGGNSTVAVRQQQLTLTLAPSTLSPGLFLAGASGLLVFGDHFVLTARNASGQAYMTITLTPDAVLSFADDFTASGAPMQTVTVHSRDLRIEYHSTQADGTLGPPVVTQVPEFGTPAPVPQPASTPALGLLLDFADGSVQGEIPVSSFHMGESLPLGSVGSASTPETFSLTLPAGADLPALFHALRGGLPNGQAPPVPLRAVLSVRNAAGQTYLTYTLGSNYFGLVVQSLEFGLDGSATLILRSTRTKLDYRPTLPDGSLGPTVTAFWTGTVRPKDPPGSLTLPGPSLFSAVSNPFNVLAPAITGLDTSTKPEGSASFTLTVNGSNFANNSVVQWNGVSLPTTFVSASQLQAVVPAADLAEEGTARITVSTSSDSTTGAQTFTIADQSPAVSMDTNLTPNGPAFSGEVATFIDPAGAEPIGNYKATIDWGDPDAPGANPTGTIGLSGGHFTVRGSHTYSAPGSYTVTVAVQDDGTTASPGAIGSDSQTLIVKTTVSVTLTNGLLDIELHAANDSAAVSVAGSNIDVFDGTFHTDFAAASVNAILAHGNGLAGQNVTFGGNISLSNYLHASGIMTETVSGNYTVASADLSAGGTIQVAAGATLTSRRTIVNNPLLGGNTGDQSLAAPIINIAQNATLQAQAGVLPGIFSLPGNITLTAASTGSTTTAQLNDQINMTSATVRGRTITIQAMSSVTATDPGASLASGATLAQINAGAQALVSIGGSSQITGSGNVTITAGSTVQTNATAPATSSGIMALDAAVATAHVNSSAIAHLSGTTTVSAGGTFTLGASNSAQVAATADGTAGGPLAAGASVAWVSLTSTTQAYIDGQASVSAGNMNVMATSGTNAATTAKSTAGGATQNNASTQQLLANHPAQTNDGVVGLAGAVAITDLHRQTQAYIASTAPVATNSLTISAGSYGDSTAVVDGSATTGTVGVGVAVAINTVQADNEATIGANTKTSATGITVSATTAGLPGDAGAIQPPGLTNSATFAPGTFAAQARAGAGATNVGAAGAVALNKVTNTNQSLIAPRAAADAGGGDVALTAINLTTDTASADPTGSAAGGNLGVGAALALDRASDTTRAEVQDSAALTGARNITLAASSSRTMQTDAQAGAAGGVAVSPAVAISLTDSTTTAQLGTGASLGLSGSLTVTAGHAGSVATSAGADAAADKVAVGACLALTTASDITTATTNRAVQAGGAVSFNALAAASSTAAAKASAKGADPSASGQQQTADKQISDQLRFAGSTRQAPSAKTSDGPVGVAAAVALDLATSSASATIPGGGSVTAGGPLSLSAGNDTDASATADGSAAGGTAAIGAAVAINQADASNLAAIGNGATVSAPSLTVAALPSSLGDPDRTDTFSARAIAGVSDSGKLGVAGAVALDLITDTSQALIKSGAVVSAAGDVALTAQGNAASTATAKAADSGTATFGVGASLALDKVTTSVRAELADQATLQGALKNVALSATSNDSASAAATAGAAGGTALAPAVGLALASNDTTARLGLGSSLSASGTLVLAATHIGKTASTAAGSADASKAAVGASLALTTADDTTTATTARSFTVGGAVTFTAQAAGSSQANAKAGAKGAKSDDAQQQQPTADQQITKQLNSLGGSNKQAPSAKTSDGSVGVAAAIAVNLATSSSQATFPPVGTYTAGGLLTLSAGNDTDASAKADGSAAGGSAVIGAAVAINRADASDQATIGVLAHVSAKGLTVSAGMSNLGDQDKTNTFSADATAGASDGTKLGVAGAVAVNLVTDTTRALIQVFAASIKAGGGDVSLTAQAKGINTATARAAQSGTATVGVGASFALDAPTTIVRAELGDLAPLTGAHNVSLSATSDESATTSATGGAAGGTAVAPAVALTLANNDTTARLGYDSAILSTLGSVSLTATHTGSSSSSASGSADGNQAAVGAALALTIADDTTTATTARPISAGGAVSFSAQAAGASKAEAKAGAKGADPGAKGQKQTTDGQVADQLNFAGTVKGLPPAKQAPSAKTSDGPVGVAAAVALNLATSSAQATIPAGGSVTAGGVLTLSAGDDTDASATADGSAAGGSTVIGAAVALNVADASNLATIGSGANVHALGLTLQARPSTLGDKDSTDTFSAQATAGSSEGTKLGVAGAVALNLITDTTQAAIASGTTKVDVGGQAARLTASGTTISSATAKAAQSGKATYGVGASLALDYASTSVRAEVADGATLTGASGMGLSAASNDSATVTATGGAAGGTAVAPAVALALVNNDTTARLGIGSQLTVTTAWACRPRTPAAAARPPRARPMA